MSSFLYFIEGPDKPVTLADAERAGVGYAFESNPPCTPLSGKTPSGKPGMLAWGPALASGAAYEPDRQEWTPVNGDGRVHVGCLPDRKPSPESLARRQQLAGRMVRLGDGHEWKIPTLAVCGPGGYTTALPRKAKRVDGKWAWVAVAAEYQQLADMFDRLFEAMYQQGQMTEEQAIEDLCVLLGWNYRLSPAECELLGLVQEDCLYAALQSAMDFETTAEWVKKKLLDTNPPEPAG